MTVPTAPDFFDRYSQADALLSGQFREVLRSRKLDPEKRLLLAILEDAVKCFQASSEGANGFRREVSQLAEQWIFTEDPEWPFSFDNVCEFLNIDPFYMRGGLTRWKNKQPHERVGQLKRLTESTGRRR